MVQVLKYYKMLKTYLTVLFIDSEIYLTMGIKWIHTCWILAESSTFNSILSFKNDIPQMAANKFKRYRYRDLFWQNTNFSFGGRIQFSINILYMFLCLLYVLHHKLHNADFRGYIDMHYVSFLSKYSDKFGILYLSVQVCLSFVFS